MERQQVNVSGHCEKDSYHKKTPIQSEIFFRTSIHKLNINKSISYDILLI